jgi:hypothetical protein
MNVYLLYHQTDPDDDNTSFLLGVYSSRELAVARQIGAATLPGFRDFPCAFIVAEYGVDVDDWPEGFETFRTRAFDRPLVSSTRLLSANSGSFGAASPGRSRRRPTSPCSRRRCQRLRWTPGATDRVVQIRWANPSA